MKATIAFGILNQLVSFFIKLTAISEVFFGILREIVLVNKVIACVIRRIYVPTDFDTKEKALSRANAAEKGLK